MSGSARLIIGAAIGVLGLVGLFLAARAPQADGLHAAGLFMFGFAVLYIYLLMKRAFDLADEERHRR
ncbi:MAG: hypothetical protein WD341_17010 [Tistlia sp.]|uniref:hypothetical protein n=1 Tax=Tistlia sp. TaxID=3057121 RepID=UPI0034A1135C